jgi:hypothetical protein
MPRGDRRRRATLISDGRAKRPPGHHFFDVCLDSEDADPSSPTTYSEDSLLQAFPEPSILYHHVPKDSFRRHLREFETAKAESRRNMDVSVLFVLAQTLPWHLAPGSS